MRPAVAPRLAGTLALSLLAVSAAVAAPPQGDGATTATQVLATSTPTPTPTSCVRDPVQIGLTGAGTGLRRTIGGYDRGLLCFRGGFISIDGAEVLSSQIQCFAGTYEAEALLQPDRENILDICRHQCGTVCRTLTITHHSATVYTVDDPADAADSDPGDGTCATDEDYCSLRAAIQEANAHAEGGTVRIELPPGVYTLSLPGDDDTALGGDLDVTREIVLAGAGAKTTFIEGLAGGTAAATGSGAGSESLQRVFEVLPEGTLFLSDVTVRRGQSAVGAGIANDGLLDLERVTVTENVAGRADGSGGSAGGIWNRGRATLRSVSIDGNRADAIDGIGTSSGGGIVNDGEMRIVDSTISRNSAVRGGGIHQSGSLQLSNVTVSGNTACCQGAGSFGGGILSDSGFSMSFTTVARNFAVTHGAGISGFVAARSSILAENPPGALPGLSKNCWVGVTQNDSAGFNVDSDGTCGFAALGDQVADPLLDDLDDNGGDTQTHALRPGSRAIDASPPFGCPDADQRGVQRPIDGDQDGEQQCDSGAFELVPEGSPLPTSSATPTHPPSPTPSPQLTPSPTPSPATIASSTPSAAATPSPTSATNPSATATDTGREQCGGDCDEDGKVTIDELVTAVSVALESVPVESCLPIDDNRDERATVDELVRAVRAAVEGCN